MLVENIYRIIVWRKKNELKIKYDIFSRIKNLFNKKKLYHRIFQNVYLNRDAF